MEYSYGSKIPIVQNKHIRWKFYLNKTSKTLKIRRLEGLIIKEDGIRPSCSVIRRFNIGKKIKQNERNGKGLKTNGRGFYEIKSYPYLG